MGIHNFFNDYFASLINPILFHISYGLKILPLKNKKFRLPFSIKVKFFQTNFFNFKKVSISI